MKNFFIVVLGMLIFPVVVYSQQHSPEIKTALLIVDIQDFYFATDTRPGLVNAEQASANAKEVLRVFREKGQLVVHVRHKSDKAAEIHYSVRPVEGEKVITKEEVNSFLNTGLDTCLRDHGITRLVIIGMQTHMCLEAAVRAAHDLGYECIVVQDACATRDLKFGETLVKASDVHAGTLATIRDGGYGTVIDLVMLKETPEKFLFQK